MNLLGHFACARHLTPLEQAGSAMGDLLPLYRRKVRPLALMTHWSREAPPDTPAARIAAGVRFHLHVDSRFHRDPLFLETSAALQTALQTASGTPGLKRFFPAHVLTEMFLDHLLMHEDGALTEAFYALFEGHLPGLLADFTAAHPEADRAAFAGFLERFLVDRFLDDYRDVDGMLWRMQRMLRRFGQRALEAREEGAVRDTLRAWGARTRPRVLQFVSAMRDAEWDRAGAAPAPAGTQAPGAQDLAKPTP
jgi:hypothetical protein